MCVCDDGWRTVRSPERLRWLTVERPSPIRPAGCGASGSPWSLTRPRHCCCCSLHLPALPPPLSDGKGYNPSLTHCLCARADPVRCADSTTQFPPARRAREGREGHRRRLVLLRPRGRRRHPHEPVERHHHRPRPRTSLPRPPPTPPPLTAIARPVCVCGAQTVHENRIYSLRIVCGATYPEQPPLVQFVSRVNLPFVNQTDGKVDPSKLPILAHWSSTSSIETVLVEIRRCVPTGSRSFHARFDTICAVRSTVPTQGDGIVQQSQAASASGREQLLSGRARPHILRASSSSIIIVSIVVARTFTVVGASNHHQGCAVFRRRVSDT